MHGAERVFQRPGVLDTLGQLTLERRIDRVTASRKIRVPAGKLRPGDGRRDVDVHGE